MDEREDRGDRGVVDRPDRYVDAESEPAERVGVPKRLWRKVRADDVGGLSAEIAYRFLFAVFPFGLFVAALGSFVAVAMRIENPAQQIIAALGDNLPASVAQELRPELEQLVANARPDLLSIGALGALWAATSGTNALVKGIHRAYEIPESRPLLLRYAVAIGLTLLGATGVIVSFVTIIGGAMLTQELAERLGVGAVAFQVLQLLRWPAVALLLTAAVAILYRYAPNVVVPWRWILAGSFAFAIGWLVATAALGVYVASFADYGATYGSLAGVIILMLWFYVTAVMLLVGAELTASLAIERSPHEIRVRREEQEAAATVNDATKGARELGDRTKELTKYRLSRPSP
jgi:membrane protein